MIIQGSPDILQGPRGLNNQFGAFHAAGDGVENLYLAVLGREADAGGLAYFQERFGDTIEPQEAIIFQQMAAAEIQARNAYFADEAAKSAVDAANARAQAAAFVSRQSEGISYFFEVENQAATTTTTTTTTAATTAAAEAAAAAAAATATTAAAAAAATAADAATKKAIADAYAAAQAAAAKVAAATTLAAKQAADALRVRALVVVKALYLQVLGREGDTAGLDYFADRFGDVIDPDELQVFKDMSKPEIDARNKYLADMAAKSKEDAAKAKVIADGFASTAAKAKADAEAAKREVYTTTTGGGGGGGINPMLILAAAAAAFFIGG
jgi:hypothetical protein